MNVGLTKIHTCGELCIVNGILLMSSSWNVSNLEKYVLGLNILYPERYDLGLIGMIFTYFYV